MQVFVFEGGFSKLITISPILMARVLGISQASVVDMCGRLKKYGLSESSSDVYIRRIGSLLDVQSVDNLPLCEEDIQWLRNARQIMLDIGMIT